MSVVRDYKMEFYGETSEIHCVKIDKNGTITPYETFMHDVLYELHNVRKERDELKHTLTQTVQDAIDLMHERNEYKKDWEGTIDSLKTSLECIDHVKNERFTLDEIMEAFNNCGTSRLPESWGKMKKKLLKPREEK